MVAAFGEILFDVFPEQELLGGAPFNFLYHIQALTGNGRFISRIGNDERGGVIRAFLQQHSIDQQYVQIDLHRPTGTAVVQVNSEGIPSFTITEESAYDYIEYSSDSARGLLNCEMLYFGTLAQRNEMSRSTLHQLSRTADRCFFDVNLRQQYYSAEILHQSFVLADIVKLNTEELERVHALFFSTRFSMDSAPGELMEKFSLSHLAVTMGENGSWMWMPEGKHFHRTAAPRMVDTVGAGDGFAAVMCAGILKNLPLKTIHRLASEFSAALCGIQGALPPDSEFYLPYKKALCDE